MCSRSFKTSSVGKWKEVNVSTSLFDTKSEPATSHLSNIVCLFCYVVFHVTECFSLPPVRFPSECFSSLD